MTTPLLGAALEYAARGWPVFPIHHPAPAGGCSCGHGDCSSPAKHPATRRGLHDATRDPDRIRRWWYQRPDANIAIRTGTASGLVVVDLDPPHGPDNFRRLAAGRFPADLAVIRTGGGGTHLYFHHTGTEIRNSAARLAPGVDIRGEGGYILAPPSQHITGNHYRARNLEKIPELPGWLDQALQRRQPDPPPWRPVAAKPIGRSWADAVLNDELRSVAHAPEGTRNNALNRAGFRLGRLASRGYLDPQAVQDQLIEAACAAGLPAREASRTAASGLDAGLRATPHTGQQR